LVKSLNIDRSSLKKREVKQLLHFLFLSPLLLSVFLTIFLYNGKQFGSDELQVLIWPRERRGE
jgi:hypothetical protein